MTTHALRGIRTDFEKHSPPEEVVKVWEQSLRSAIRSLDDSGAVLIDKEDNGWVVYQNYPVPSYFHGFGSLVFKCDTKQWFWRDPKTGEDWIIPRGQPQAETLASQHFEYDAPEYLIPRNA